MYSELMTGLYGTVIVWVVSAVLAIILGFGFAIGLSSNNPLVRAFIVSLVNFSRGVPTSIYVLLGGLLVMKGVAGLPVPAIFPGTIDGFELIAWSITFALAFGSSGHLATIFVASYSSLGKARLDQFTAMGFSPLQRLMISVRECAYIALPSTSTRMIHHLHNTAFASLFPVVELFGSIQTCASTTFKVFEITLLGCGLYVFLSGLVWLFFRTIESVLSPQTGLLRTRIEMTVS